MNAQYLVLAMLMLHVQTQLEVLYVIVMMALVEMEPHVQVRHNTFDFVFVVLNLCIQYISRMLSLNHIMQYR